MQAQRLIGLLAEHGSDFAACSLAFECWCTDNIKPWFDDHVHWDTDLIRRWSGQDVDLTRPLPSDLIATTIAARRATCGSRPARYARRCRGTPTKPITKRDRLVGMRTARSPNRNVY